ncbi:hypothetical protein I4U23_022007 [Adineta vaga]|nr:hypothetical protein I4U23_022007 [Adineta vaga]
MHIFYKSGLVLLLVIIITIVTTIPVILHLRQPKNKVLTSNETTTTMPINITEGNGNSTNTMASMITNAANTTIISISGVTITNSENTTPIFAPAAPPNLVEYRDTDQTLAFLVVGSNSDDVWGSMIYTDDSPLAVAVVHSGFVQLNQICIVTFKILPGQSSYIGSTQNGITSKSWTTWWGSYTIINATCIQ